MEIFDRIMPSLIAAACLLTAPDRRYILYDGTIFPEILLQLTAWLTNTSLFISLFIVEGVMCLSFRVIHTGRLETKCVRGLENVFML